MASNLSRALRNRIGLARIRIGLAIIAWIFLLLTVYGWFIPEPGPNELSRIDLTHAIVFRHTTAIDAYAANTIDRAQANGHWYSDKPLGLSLLAVPVLYLGHLILGLGDLGLTRVSYVSHLLTIATVALPAALLAPCVAFTAMRLGARPGSSIAAAVAMALGTALLPFASTFYAHATSAALGFAAFGAVVFSRSWLGGWERTAIFSAGFLAGLAALVEYPVLLIGILLALWLILSRTPPGLFLIFLLGGAIALAPLPLYNAISFGAPWRLGYAFVDQAAFGGMSSGLFGVTLPRLEALVEILIGPPGLFTQSPFLLAAFWGFSVIYRQGQRGTALFALSVCMVFVLYNSSCYLPMGGQTSGPRFLLPIIPFLSLGLAFVPWWSWLVLGPLAVTGFGHVMTITAVEPKTGPGLLDPFRAYWWPRLQAGDLAQSWSEIRFGALGLAVFDRMVLPLGLGVIAALGASISMVRRSFIAVLLFTLSAVALWTYLVSPFRLSGIPHAFRLATDTSADQTIVRYGGVIDLVGHDAPSEVRPGDPLDITLFWRAIRPVEENLTVFVHAVGRDGVVVGGFDGAPVGNGFPTNMWTPGTTLRSTYRLRINSAAVTPSELKIVVGFYPPGVVRPIDAVDGSGRALDSGPAPIRVALRQHGVIDPRPARASFREGLDLVNWIPPAPTRPGGGTTVELAWRARERPTRDLTIFVQVLGQGRLVAQWDGQPLRGAYPTSLWPAGELVNDLYILTTQMDTTPGDYPVIVGMYMLPEVRRLFVQGGEGIGQDHVIIGLLRVEH